MQGALSRILCIFMQSASAIVCYEQSNMLHISYRTQTSRRAVQSLPTLAGLHVTARRYHMHKHMLRAQTHILVLTQHIPSRQQHSRALHCIKPDFPSWKPIACLSKNEHEVFAPTRSRAPGSKRGERSAPQNLWVVVRVFSTGVPCVISGKVRPKKAQLSHRCLKRQQMRNNK